MCKWYDLRTNQGEERGRAAASIMRRGEAGRDHVTHGTTVNAQPPTADSSMRAPGMEESTSVGHARQHQNEASSAEKSDIMREMGDRQVYIHDKRGIAPAEIFVSVVVCLLCYSVSMSILRLLH